MGKVYTLDDNGECLAELKAMHDEKKLMKVRLERDEITPDEWRGWYAGYRDRLDEIRKAVSGMRDELSLRHADLEALAMGKAVVSSDVIGNRDCVKDGYNGYLLPMVASSFAEKCCSLIEDENLREKMGQNSFRYFEKEFLIDNRIKDLENIYRKVDNA